MSKSTDNLVFRNFLTNDIAATKALAFSPDIVPHFGNNLDAELLINGYDQYIALPLQPSEINNVYVRASTASSVSTDTQTAIVLRAVPSELILWPQVWNTTKALGPGPLVIDSSTSNTVVALDTPFKLTPNNMGGFNYALIATQATFQTNYNLQNPNTRLRDALSAPPADVKNWKDMVDFINSDTSTAFSNVVIADPNAPFISVSTRLHVIDDGVNNLNFLITIENSVMPPGTLVSLSSPSGMINLGRTAIAEDIGVHVSLPPGFDDTITLNIFPADEASIETFAWVSLQASIVVPQSFTSGIPISTVHLLGAQNIVFHDDATTNLRFASPAANQLSDQNQSLSLNTAASTVPPATPKGWWWSGKNKQQALALTDTTEASTNALVTGAAAGWWFRDALGNPNLFPRTATLSHSPDIQPVGISPRSDVQTILGGGNQNTDWSEANKVAISQGAPNYVYLRGNCTLGSNYATEFRLFIVPSALLLYPPEYSQFSIMDFDDDGDPFVATRTITSASANSFNVLDLAFDILNPQPPPAGSDHYCLIAEARNPTPANPDPDWPHEDSGAFSSGAGFNTWVGGTPTVCWRNVSYVPGGAQLTCTTNVAIPAGYSSSTEWTLEVDAVNAPVGSAWRLTGSGPAIPGLSIGFTQTTITATNATEGCHFTGLPTSGYTFSVVLQWFGQGKPPGNGMSFSFLLFTTTPAAANIAGNNIVNVASLPDSAGNWPFTVGIHHPGVEGKGNNKKKTKGYLGRRYKNIGTNPWPHAPNFTGNNLKSPIVPSTIYSIGADHWVFH